MFYPALLQFPRGNQILFASWSSVVVQDGGHLQLHGHFCGTTFAEPVTVETPSNDVRSVFGDLNGPLGLLIKDGKVYTLERDDNVDSMRLCRAGDDSSPTLSHVAVNGTGRVAAIMLQAKGSRMIHCLEFSSYQVFEKWYLDPSAKPSHPTGDMPYRHHMTGGRAKTLLSGATCFITLTDDGEVLSFGDARFPACLGRRPTDGCPASQLSTVAALGGIKIVKIDGCGWMFGALSDSGDLYLFGRDGPGLEDGLSLAKLLGGGNEEEEEVRLLEDYRLGDVLDFAVGNGHVVVSTKEGIFGIGDNRGGQLGSDGVGTFFNDWRKLSSACPVILSAAHSSTMIFADKT